MDMSDWEDAQFHSGFLYGSYQSSVAFVDIDVNL